MRVESHTPDVGGGQNRTVELVSRARQRTLEELNSLTRNHSVSYATAIAGNTPHATLPNGITIVMRRCGSWSC